MYRLVPCIPILGFFLLKVQKQCVYVIMLKIALLLVKIYVLVGKKGIRGLERQIAAKHTGDIYSLEFYFSPHHRNILSEYKLQRKPIMK